MALLGVGTGVLPSCLGLGWRSSVGGKMGVPEMERRFVVVVVVVVDDDAAVVDDDAVVACGGGGSEGGARGARGDGEAVLAL
jgi:hypothetical protein